MTDTRATIVAAAIRSTREYRAGIAFGVPEDAHQQYLDGIVAAVLAALDADPRVAVVDLPERVPGGHRGHWGWHPEGDDVYDDVYVRQTFAGDLEVRIPDYGSCPPDLARSLAAALLAAAAAAEQLPGGAR